LEDTKVEKDDKAKLGTVENPITLVVGDPVICWATPGQQMGLPFVAGKCPMCGQALALSEFGCGACYGCNQWLEFRDAALKPDKKKGETA
jgi:hypothetical protein